MTNGYEKPCSVDIMVRADMLETIAGYDDHDMAREITFARSMTDCHDADALRWLVCLAARRIAELSAT